MPSNRESGSLPNEPGGYALVFDLAEPVRVRPGKLGIVELPSGYYLYMGSALSGLAPRLARHLRRRKKRHWHIDALTSVVRPHQIWWIAAGDRRECDWADVAVSDLDANRPVVGFGSSDCRCASHLIRLSGEQALERVRARIETSNPGTQHIDVPARLTKRFLNMA